MLKNVVEIEIWPGWKVPIEISYCINENDLVVGQANRPEMGLHGSADYSFEAKVSKTPDVAYGINGGCISKLYIKDLKSDVVIVDYDQGDFNIASRDPCEIVVYGAIIKAFNKPHYGN